MARRGRARVEREAVEPPEQHALLGDAVWDVAEFRARQLREYLAGCRAFAREEA